MANICGEIGDVYEKLEDDETALQQYSSGVNLLSGNFSQHVETLQNLYGKKGVLLRKLNRREEAQEAVEYSSRAETLKRNKKGKLKESNSEEKSSYQRIMDGSGFF